MRSAVTHSVVRRVYPPYHPRADFSSRVAEDWIRLNIRIIDASTSIQFKSSCAFVHISMDLSFPSVKFSLILLLLLLVGLRFLFRSRVTSSGFRLIIVALLGPGGEMDMWRRFLAT